MANYKKGDVNMDGIINEEDYNLVSNASIGAATLTDEQKALADLDGDGEITSFDAYKISVLMAEEKNRLSKVYGFKENGARIEVPTKEDLNNLDVEINVIDNLTSTSAIDPLSAKQGKVLNDKINNLNIPAATTVIDNLTSNSATAALSANQGRVLNEKIDNLDIPNAVTVVDNVSSTSATSALSANQGKILNDKIGVLKVNALPTPSADLVDTVYRYNGELYVCEEDKKLYTGVTVTTGTNLNGARFHLTNILNASYTSILDASDGQGNTLHIYGGDPDDNKTGQYGLYIDLYVNGAYVYQGTHMGDYTDRGEKISIEYIDMPELDLVVTNATGVDNVFNIYNAKTGNYIMRKVSQEKQKYFGNYRLSISKSSSTEGTIQSGDVLVGKFFDDLGIVGGCDLNYAEGIEWADTQTLICNKEGVYRFDTQVFTGAGSYLSIGTIHTISMWVSINGSDVLGSYNYYRYDVGGSDNLMLNESLTPMVVPLAVGDTIQVKCKLHATPVWRDTSSSYHAININGQMAISEI